MIGSYAFPNKNFLKEIMFENILVLQTSPITLNNKKIIYNEKNKLIGACGGPHCDCCTQISTLIEYCEAKNINYCQKNISNLEELEEFIEFCQNSIEQMNIANLFVKLVGRNEISICMDNSNNSSSEKCHFEDENQSFAVKGFRKDFLLTYLIQIW